MKKIVDRVALPIGDEHVLFLEVDNKGELWDTVYEKGIHMTQREISKEIGLAEPVVCLVMKKSLKKFYNNIRRNNSFLNPIELTSLVAQMLNVKTDVQFKRYIRALPDEIKKEVFKYARENYCH